jgi:anti-sigma factor RsiW
MKACNDIRTRLSLYLDNELQGEERAQFESHLQECDSCKSLALTELRFLNSVRQAQPLYVASPELQSRIQTALSIPSTGVTHSSHQRFAKRARFVAALVAATLFLLLLPVLVWRALDNGPRSHGVSNFALMAADTHLRHMRGQLPLEMTSTEPQAVSHWFDKKVSFSVKIPNYQESAGEKLYILEGARLVAYKNDYAAYVAYEMKDRPISLVITSDSVAEISGGEEIQAKGLIFHYNAIQGLKVLTWSDRGLTYALVSDLEERGKQSCIVCHQGIKDQDFIAPLKPR